MDEIKRSVSDLVIESLMIGLSCGYLTEEQFLEYMQEAQDIMNDSPEEIQRLLTV